VEKKSDEFFDTNSIQFNDAILEDVLDVLIDYRGKTPKKTDSGIPLVTAKIVKDGTILPYNEYISENDYDEWMTRGVPQAGDVVITTEAPLGEVARLDTTKIALAQRIILLRGKKGVLDNGYLKYILQTEQVRHQLNMRSSGSTVTGIKQSELKKITIPLTDYKTQKEIAHILGTLDDKIELNRKMNKTLEEIAQTLYKHWFIDFEFPNEEGKPYKSSGGEMIESELGPIPKSWRVGKVGDLCTFEYGKSLVSNTRQQGKYPVMGSNGQVGWHNEALAKGPGIVIGRKGNPGTVKWVHDDFYPIDTSFYVNPRFTTHYLSYIYYMLTTVGLKTHNSDSAVPGLNRTIAQSIRVILPANQIMTDFSNMISRLFNITDILEKQGYSLIYMRSALLYNILSCN